MCETVVHVKRPTNSIKVLEEKLLEKYRPKHNTEKANDTKNITINTNTYQKTL